jgi:hypothetical protein
VLYVCWPSTDQAAQCTTVHCPKIFHLNNSAHVGLCKILTISWSDCTVHSVLLYTVPKYFTLITPLMSASARCWPSADQAAQCTLSFQPSTFSTCSPVLLSAGGTTVRLLSTGTGTSYPHNCVEGLGLGSDPRKTKRRNWRTNGYFTFFYFHNEKVSNSTWQMIKVFPWSSLSILYFGEKLFFQQFFLPWTRISLQLKCRIRIRIQYTEHAK